VEKQYRLFIVADRNGAIDAWASERPLERSEALSLLQRELDRSGRRLQILGSGAHRERPGDWVTVSFRSSSSTTRALDAVGLAPDERSARLLVRLIELRGGSAVALRVHRISAASRRGDDEPLRALRSPKRSACRRCGLPRDATRRHRRDCA
jgi:hypothetical protein